MRCDEKYLQIFRSFYLFSKLTRICSRGEKVPAISSDEKVEVTESMLTLIGLVGTESIKGLTLRAPKTNPLVYCFVRKFQMHAAYDLVIACFI